MPGVKNRCLLSSINGQRTKHCELAQEIGERRSATIPEAANELGAENGRVSARLNALQVPSFADEQKLGRGDKIGKRKLGLIGERRNHERS
jgi:hypothetical protein